MSVNNRQVVLRGQPERAPAAGNCEIEVPPVRDGDVLQRTVYLSLDPCMTGS